MILLDAKHVMRFDFHYRRHQTIMRNEAAVEPA